MKTLISLLFLLFAQSIAAAPVVISCNGDALNPKTGRPVGQSLTFAFEFDQQAQTMILTQGSSSGRLPLTKVSVTDVSAKGIGKDDWAYEINRIEGVATIHATDPDSIKYGLSGNFFKGTCAANGQAKF